MKLTNPIEIPEVVRKIDTVLKLFAKNSLAKDGLEIGEALEMTNLLFDNENPKIQPTDKIDFFKILEKLMKDGFINNVAGNQYEATYDGTVTSHLGGYSRKYLEGLEIQQLQSHRDRVAKRLTSINLWIAIATGIAAIYYLDQLCSKYHLFSICPFTLL